ncbi:MAG: DUF3488 and DUF4129 domain-containing transglutaminase family protein, partial [Nitrospiraceae bacterium]
SIVMAGSGFTGLCLTGELPLALVILGFAALVVGVGRLSGSGGERLQLDLSRQTWNGVIIVAFLFFVIDLLWISGDLLQAGVHFLVLLMMNKLFTLRTRSDFLHLYAISQMELLAAAALTVELWYAAVFIVYLLAAIWTLLLYHLRHEAEEAQLGEDWGTRPEESSRTAGLITARFFWSTNGIALGAFCLTLIIFFITPRIGVGFFQKNRAELIRTTGFSEKVDLGVIGSVKQDSTVVMRVEFPEEKGPLIEQVYFRGAAYDVYNGRSWANTFARRRDLLLTSHGAFRVANTVPRGTAKTGLRQVILVEALDTAALFGVPFVDSIKGNFRVVLADGMDSLFLRYPPASRFQYTARSIPNRLAPEDRVSTSLRYPNPILEHFLQLPDISPRVAALSREVTEGAQTPFQMAVAIKQYLRGNYRYSLDVGMSASASPIEDFLFTRKTGYCEHYATAMVVLLRTLGIPARLATGFLPGEWNDFGNYYTVRQRDAHAWVEVYFPHSGWVTFDPTPSEFVPVPNPVWAKVARVIDTIRLKWDRFVIQYSFRDQIAVAQDIRDRTDRVREEASVWLATARRWVTEMQAWVVGYAPPHLWLALALVAVCTGLVGLYYLVRNRGALRPGGRSPGLQSAEQRTIVRLYSQMLRLLTARGITKTGSSTPLEFARSVAQEWFMASQFVDPLTHLYCRVRFGQKALPPSELQQ